MGMKKNIIEERSYEQQREIVNITYEELNPRLWGGIVPRVTLSFDEKNQYMMKVVIRYDCRKARKNERFTIDDVKTKIFADLRHQQVFFGEEEMESKVVKHKHDAE